MLYQTSGFPSVWIRVLDVWDRPPARLLLKPVTVAVWSCWDHRCRMSLPRRFLESTEHFHIQHLLPCLYTVRAVDSRARPTPSFLSEATRHSISWDTRLTTNCLTSAVHKSTSMYKLQVMSITVFPGRGGRHLCCQSRRPSGGRSLGSGIQKKPIRFALAMHTFPQPTEVHVTPGPAPVWSKFNYTTAVATF